MLRADLIRKLNKTPASESKLSRRSRKTIFEEKKLQDCHSNSSKSLWNVFEWPENQRITRSMSKSPNRLPNPNLLNSDKTPITTLNIADLWPESQNTTTSKSKANKRVNLGLPKCDLTPKATLNSVGQTPRSQCKPGSETSNKIRASFASRAINFNEFITKATTSGEKNYEKSTIKTPRSTKKVSSKPMRFNLRESAMVATLLKDESPASLVSSPGQTIETAEEIFNTPNRNTIERVFDDNLPSVSMLGIESETNLNFHEDSLSPNIVDTVVQTPNPTPLNAFKKVPDDDLPSVSMLGTQIETNLNCHDDSSSPNIVDTAVRTPNPTPLNAFKKVPDDDLPSVSMLGIQIETNSNCHEDTPSPNIVGSAVQTPNANAFDKVLDDTLPSVSMLGFEIESNAKAGKISPSACLVSSVIAEAITVPIELPNENDNDEDLVLIENELDDARNVSYSIAVSEKTADGQPKALISSIPKDFVIDLTASPVVNNKINGKAESYTKFSPPKMIETIAVHDASYIEKTITEQHSTAINNLTFSPEPKENNSQANTMSKTKDINDDEVVVSSGVRDLGRKKTTLPSKIVPFRFGNSYSAVENNKSFRFKMQTTSTPLPIFNKVNKESRTEPKIQPKKNSIYSRAEAANRAKLSNDQREERRIAMFENSMKKTKTPSSEQLKTEIKGVRMNRRMQLLFANREALKKK